MKHYLIIILCLLFSIDAFSSTREGLDSQLKRLEESYVRKIGLYAVNTNNHEVITYRANQRFSIQSTYKLIAVAALLHKSDKDKSLLNKKIFYSKKDLNYWHPITGRHLKSGMSLGELAEAAISYSDNTATNLITKSLGGPESVTYFAHSIGNKSFQCFIMKVG